MKAYRLFSLVLALVMLFTLTACGGTKEAAETKAPAADAVAEAEKPVEATTITFSLWDEVQSVTYQKMIDAFEAKNPDIHVEMQLTPWDQYWTKFDAAAGANQAADVFWINTFICKYADAGVLEPLDAYIADSGMDMSGYVSAVTESFQYEGAQYAIPKGVDSCAVVYNKALFAKYGVAEPQEGWTWADLKETAKQLSENIAAAGGSEYGVVLPISDQNSFVRSYIYQAGGSYLDAEKRHGTFEDEKIANAIADVMGMVDEGIIPNITVVQENAPIDLMLSGKACLTYVMQIKAPQFNDSSMSGDFGLVTMPKVENNCYVPAVMGYAMNSSSDKKDAAWRFLEFLGGEEANKIMAENGADFPALVSAQQYYAASFDNIDASAFERQLKNVIAMQIIPVRDKTSSEETKTLVKIFSGELAIDEGLAQLNKINNDALDEWYETH